MSRRFWLIILGIGTVLGFASGIYSLRWRHFAHDGQGWHGRHHAAFEARVADICTRSAERVFRGEAAPPKAPPPTP